MTLPTSVRFDPDMKRAIEKLAKIQFIPVSSLIKQAVEKHLEDHGIDWKKESDDED